MKNILLQDISLLGKINKILIANKESKGKKESNNDDDKTTNQIFIRRHKK